VLDLLDDSARRALDHAQDEARALGHAFIGTEHLLLGMLKVEGGLATRLLRSFGVEPYHVRASVEAAVGRAEGPTKGAITLTPRARNALELALREARGGGAEHVGVEHLFVGVLRENVGAGRTVLNRHGVTVETARRAIAELASEAAPVVETPAASAPSRFTMEQRTLLEGVDQSLGVRQLARYIGVPQRRVRELAAEIRAVLDEL